MSVRALDHTNFSLSRLRSFLAVYDAGTIAKAARNHPNPVAQQSQMSRQISELREVFGGELFEGAGLARRPTELGHALARLARDFEDGLADLQARAADAPARCAVGAGDSVLHWLLLPSLHEVEDLLPAALGRRVQWQLGARDNADVEAELPAGRVDLGVVLAAEPPADDRPGTARGAATARRAKIGRLSFRLFAARRGGRTTPAWPTLLAAAPLAAVTSEPAVRDAIAHLGVEVRSGCETYPQVARAVETGRWVGVLPHTARSELPAADFWSVEAPPLKKLATTLWLAARPRLVDVRPELGPVRDALARVLASHLRDPAGTT